MTREFSSLSSPLAFLDSKFATEGDTVLISQVEIWSTNSRIFDTFGVDPETKIESRLLPQLRRLNIALETWRDDPAHDLFTVEMITRYIEGKLSPR